MKELASLHDKHLNRPTLDDSSEEEHAIEITTQEITQVRAPPAPQTPIINPAGDVLGFYIPAGSPHRDYELPACAWFSWRSGHYFSVVGRSHCV